jgi:hypothetical protein
MDNTLRKVQTLRVYLATLQEYTTPSLERGLASRGGFHGAGSRFGAVRSWLLPEILLCLNRNDDTPLFIVVTKSSEAVNATLQELDKWLEEHEQEIVQQEVSTSLRALQRAASRLTNRADKSSAHRAVSQLQKIFDMKRRAAS